MHGIPSIPRSVEPIFLVGRRQIVACGQVPPIACQRFVIVSRAKFILRRAGRKIPVRRFTDWSKDDDHAVKSRGHSKLLLSFSSPKLVTKNGSSNFFPGRFACS